MLTMLAFCGGLTRHASTAAEAMASDRKCCRSRSSAKMWPSAWPLTTRANGRVPLTGLRTWMMRSAAPGGHKGPHQVRGDVPKHSHATTPAQPYSHNMSAHVHKERTSHARVGHRNNDSLFAQGGRERQPMDRHATAKHDGSPTSGWTSTKSISSRM